MDGAHVIAGTLIAGAMTGFIAVADAIPATWWEGGVFVVFAGCLFTAALHLWKALRASERARHEQDQAMIERLQDSVDRQERLVAANEQRNQEQLQRLSEALERLAEKKD